MHAAAISLRGGVSPRSTRLREQSIIEYVLIIAVIGLVIVFAGPQSRSKTHGDRHHRISWPALPAVELT